jgi:enolase
MPLIYYSIVITKNQNIFNPFEILMIKRGVILMQITKIKAREILDSRGNPTVEVDLFTEECMVRASVPSGASKGVHEAIELRDGGKRYNGNGVKNAVENIEMKIAPKLLGLEVVRQDFIDTMMCSIDGTENKSKLGANAILAVSIAACKAGAKSKNMQLYKYIQEISETKKIEIPKAYFNVINGGKHAGNGIDFQEYMIVPQAETFKENLMMASVVYHNLKNLLKEKYGLNSVNVGDEGGFAPPLENNEEPLKLLVAAIGDSGFSGKVRIAMDVASSEFYYGGKYLLGKKNFSEKEKEKLAVKEGISGEELTKFYNSLIKKYPIISIEDLFAQDDWKNWHDFMRIAKGIQIVGDDLLVTNAERIKIALEKEACNALLLKVNQIGTVSEAIKAAKLAIGNNWKVMVSHRSGETEDTFIADLCVGLGTGQIKSGAPCRTERVAKYNQLMRIEEELSSKDL